jgi:hypothetical protein
MMVLRLAACFLKVVQIAKPEDAEDKVLHCQTAEQSDLEWVLKSVDLDLFLGYMKKGR